MSKIIQSPSASSVSQPNLSPYPAAASRIGDRREATDPILKAARAG
jgi:hypothetical protein